MTLTEFLLARIADDEAPYLTLPEGTRFEVRCSVFDPAAGWIVIPDAVADVQRSRVLAECEAKRQIVEGFDCYATTRDAGWMVTDIFQLLALPYADHHDYREEWRP